MGLDSNNAVFITGGGKLWIANGMDSPHALSLHTIGAWKQRTAAAPPRIAVVGTQRRFVEEDLHSYNATPDRTVISATVSASAVAYVTDNGRVYMLGRHAMHCQADTGMVAFHMLKIVDLTKHSGSRLGARAHSGGSPRQNACGGNLKARCCLHVGPQQYVR